MAKDKTSSTEGRRLAARTERYDVSYFASKHGLSVKDAQRILNTHGSDRDAADRAAQRLKE